jgi:RNA-directed DNA polymerase
VKKADNSNSKNYPTEVELEAQGKKEEPSDEMAKKKEEDKVNEGNQQLLGQILSKANLREAYHKVVQNKGAAGIDKVEVQDLLKYLQENWEGIKKQLLKGEYAPQPVRRVEIPKPDGSGMRLLGIPTVLDRMIQQAIAQILSPIFDKEFSNYSYGFRPKKSAHDAILQSQEYIRQGYNYVVDIDLEKFFDRVNHDKLMYLISKKIEDKEVLRLIRKYLQSGVMINGVVMETEEGTPQGGPMSPLLSNIMLNELDIELEKRGHKFCRYADDCNIYVKSQKAGDRVMLSVSDFIESKLKLKVNKEKSAVDKPRNRKFLGFSFYPGKGGEKMRLHTKTLERIKTKIKKLTQRSKSESIEEKISGLSNLVQGWVNYFRIADMKAHCQTLDEWMRRRLRMCIWKQWKKIKAKHDNLIKLGIEKSKAWEFANTRKGYWHIANSPILSTSITNKYLEKEGLLSFSTLYLSWLKTMNRRMPNGTYGGVRGQVVN